MTKKHFRSLANAMHQIKPLPEKSSTPEDAQFVLLGWVRCVSAIADVCQNTNPRFDRGKFLDACEKGL